VGYQRNPKVYKFTFDDTTDYPGLEVQVRTLTMGQLLEVWSGKGTSSATFEVFASQIVSWNLEDEAGQPVPVTREALLAEDDDMIQAIVKKWIAEVMGVPAPLESDSGSGETSAAELRLAELPSESLVS
jgi:hypothetical protein